MALKKLSLLLGVLLTLSMTSCKAPKMERAPKIFVPDNESMALVRAMGEKEKDKDCQGELVEDEGQRLCIVPYGQIEHRFSCMNNADYGLIVNYISELVFTCQRWRKAKN